MELQVGTIKHLQEYVAEKIKSRGFESETLHERLLLLTEELGELVKACRKMSGMNIDQGKKYDYNPGEEVVDVINLVFSVAVELGLDVEKEFIEKNKIVDQRYYKRSN
jgi:NTP pyrophosphatase (non-canonical NTP hydrolase)